MLAGAVYTVRELRLPGRRPAPNKVGALRPMSCLHAFIFSTYLLSAPAEGQTWVPAPCSERPGWKRSRWVIGAVSAKGVGLG